MAWCGGPEPEGTKRVAAPTEEDANGSIGGALALDNVLHLHAPIVVQAKAAGGPLEGPASDKRRATPGTPVSR